MALVKLDCTNLKGRTLEQLMSEAFLYDDVADCVVVNTAGGGGGGGGDASAANQTLMISELELQNFTKKAGNSVEYAYYAVGPTPPANPSGNKNLETATYKVGAVTQFTITYEYDTDDDIVKQTIA